MTKNKKKRATQQVRLYPKTYRRLKVEAAKSGVTLAELIDQKV